MNKFWNIILSFLIPSRRKLLGSTNFDSILLKRIAKEEKEKKAIQKQNEEHAISREKDKLKALKKKEKQLKNAANPRHIRVALEYAIRDRIYNPTHDRIWVGSRILELNTYEEQQVFFTLFIEYCKNNSIEIDSYDAADTLYLNAKSFQKYLDRLQQPQTNTITTSAYR